MKKRRRQALLGPESWRFEDRELRKLLIETHTIIEQVLQAVKDHSYEKDAAGIAWSASRGVASFCT